MHLPFLSEMRDLFDVRAVCDISPALVEKPMCFSREEGLAMIAAVEERVVTLIVGYMKRYDPGYEYAQHVFHSMQGVRLIRIHDLTGQGPLAPQEVYNLYRADDLSQELRARMQAESQARFAAGLGYDDPALVRAYALMLGLSSHDMTVLRGACAPGSTRS